MTLQHQEQERSIGSDLEKITISITHITEPVYVLSTSSYIKYLHTHIL